MPKEEELLQSGAAELDKSSLHSEPASVFNKLSWRSDQMTRLHVTKKPENHRRTKKKIAKRRRRRRRDQRMRSNDEQVSWSTSNNKAAAATQIPSKVFFPTAFRFTVSLQQKRAKRQSSCSSFFLLVGHPTSPQSFTHKNKNNSKKNTHTQTHK
jgi:hypothetical protein